jgi:succinyl-diaminopimelate desuccinylase
MPSITPDDGHTLTLIKTLLAEHDFYIEHIDEADTKNLFAYYGDVTKPLLLFLGHVDVVPAGPESEWKFPPFQATEHEGIIYGRGAADMKSGVAAMTSALVEFVQHYPDAPFRAGILLTSDEEGKAQHGVKHVMEVFKARGEKIDYCIVGEPSSQQYLADTMKIGRRGSLSGKITIFGKQGHIAYPEKSDNPIHRFAPVLTQLSLLKLDQGNEHFQPTQIQFSNIHAGVGADNVIPGSLQADFNLRYSPAITAEAIETQITKILTDAKLNFQVEWHFSGLPFLTSKGLLLECAIKIIQEATSRDPQLSTIGGTSDGRFIAPTGAQVIEVGVCNETIHQVNECVKIVEVTGITEIYYGILKEFASKL